MPLPDIAVGTILGSLVSVLIYRLRQNYIKRSDSTALFLELRRGYTEFYRRLHNAFKDLDYKDEVNISASWSSYTKEQQAIAKEYWIQTFNEWFACNRMANTGGHELWRSFYAPAVASSLRHYVFRRALEESICELYSFGDNESLFIREIYRISVQEIHHNLKIQAKSFLAQAPRPLSRQEIASISESDFIGSGGRKERDWYRKLSTDVNEVIRNGGARREIPDQSLKFVEFLLIMLKKLTEREHHNHYSSPGQAIADVGRKMLLGISVEAEQRTDLMDPEITLALKKEYRRIFSVEFEDTDTRANIGNNTKQPSLKRKPAWQQITGSVDLSMAKSWLVCVAAQRAAVSGNYGIGAVVFNGEDYPVAIGTNSMFAPRFKSSAHAEMEALDKLERRMDRSHIKKCHLISSLEPCPMCCCRLITSGLKDLQYLASDEDGGIVKEFDQRMPNIWRELFKKANYRWVEGGRLNSDSVSHFKQLEKCNYSEMSKTIFMHSKPILDPKLH